MLEFVKSCYNMKEKVWFDINKMKSHINYLSNDTN